jgi:S-adenosylmethionine:tRNA ribosyltransferase-isomerase
MMVSAFCGHDLMKRAYETIKEEYKFYSYGDAMLII